MRTTVDIPDDLLAEAKASAASQHRTLSAYVSDLIRVALVREAKPRERVVLPTYGDPGGKLLVDIYDREAVADALGDNEFPRATS